MSVPGIDTSTESLRHPESNLAQQIQDRLGRRIHDFKVTVHAQGLVLSGRVPNYYTKQLAQQAAMELGATILTNDIQVV